jgi:hypothetical protein
MLSSALALVLLLAAVIAAKTVKLISVADIRWCLSDGGDVPSHTSSAFAAAAASS